MTICKRKASRAIMIRGRLINPRVHIRIEKACIVDAARMLIQKHPRIGRARVNELAGLFDVFINRIPRPALGIALTNPNVA
jgi:hypothetical protein